MRLAPSGGVLARLGGLALLALLCLVRLWDPLPIQFLRVKSFDVYQTLRPSTNAERPVVIVDIDEASLKAHGQWPWPRTLLAALLERLAEAGTVAVGFDMIFAEADRHSPAVYAGGNPELPAPLREALGALPDNDKRFAAAMARLPTVLGIALVREGAGSPLDRFRSAPVATLGDDPRPHLVASPALLANLAELHAAASGAGMLTHNSEFDGTVRRVPTVFRVGQRLYPTLAVELIRVATGGNTLVVKTNENGVQSVVMGPDDGRVEVPTDRRGRLWVRASPHDPARYVSAADLLAGRVPKDRLAGRLALVGTSAVGLLDLKATPLESSLPGVEIHAQIVENILFKDHVARPYYADAVEFFAMIALALLLIAILPSLGALRTLLSGFAMAGIVTLGAWLFFVQGGLLFDITFPMTASFAIFVALAFFNYVREERAKRWVRRAFGQYVSPEFVAQLADHPDRLKLGGEMRELTVLFTDVRGFTGISEKLTATELTDFMTRMFTPLTEVVLARKGTLDKYIGDAIMAFWNAPLDDPRHAENACRAALQMLVAMEKFSAENAALRNAAGEAMPPARIGIGLNTGPCCVGNLGAGQRFNYSAIGDPVNVAARLEGETKHFGVPIIVGETTAQGAAMLALLELGRIQVRGRAGQSRIYALLGDEAVAAGDAFKTLAAANARFHAALAAGDAKAAEAALAELRGLGRADLATLFGRYQEMLAAPERRAAAE